MEKELWDSLFVSIEQQIKKFQIIVRWSYFYMSYLFINFLQFNFLSVIIIFLIRLNQFYTMFLCWPYHSNTEAVLFACLLSDWTTATGRLLGPKVGNSIKRVLNPNFRQFNFELRKNEIF